jgi:hypothetical protein
MESNMFSNLVWFAAMRRVKSIVFLMILMFFADSGLARDVSLKDVPAAVKLTIEKEAKGYEIDDIEQETDDGRVVYEVDIDKGDDNEIKIKVSPEGKLLEKEEEMYPEELPGFVLKAIEKSIPGLDLDDAEMKIESDGKV